MQGKNRLRMIEGVIYRLKRGYGLPLAIYQQLTDDVDLTTGVKTVTKSVLRIKRAIVFPNKAQKTFNYDIGYLRANANFTYGGHIQEGVRVIAIDRKDLPRDYTITPSETSYIIFDHKRYEIKDVVEFEFKTAYLIKLVEVKGAPIYEIHEPVVRDKLTFTEESGGQL